MKLSEFKAWFEGFTESMTGAPDEDQWKRIKARIAEIDGVAVTQPVFIDRYVHPYRPYWSQPMPPQIWSQIYNTAASDTLPRASMKASFDSHSAMGDLGRAEYKHALDA